MSFLLLQLQLGRYIVSIYLDRAYCVRMNDSWLHKFGYHERFAIKRWLRRYPTPTPSH